MKHPVYRYIVYAIIKDNTIQAICVIRPKFKEDSIVFSLVDFIGPNKAFPLIRNLIFFLFKELEAEYVILHSYGLPLNLFIKQDL